MIERIRIRGFKSLKEVDLRLGWFNLFVGANASGKSNFLDAIRLIQGIGLGLRLDEILNGKPASSTNQKWEGIRGGPGHVTFQPLTEEGVLYAQGEIEVEVDFFVLGVPYHYQIEFDAQYNVVIKESLESYASHAYRAEREDSTLVVTDELGTQRYPADAPVLRKHPYRAEEIPDALSDCQYFNPSLDNLRDYSRARAARMGEHGEDFASVVESILSDAAKKSAYLSWLRELVPNEFHDVLVKPGAMSDLLFAVKEGDRELPAPVLSDGTLRFAALAAVFFQPSMPKTLLLEEVENGIHPTRLRLIHQLLKTQSSLNETQVFATTHSPSVLDWLEEEDYPFVFLCRRDEESGASRIGPLSEISRLKELKTPLGELFTEGWLETAV